MRRIRRLLALALATLVVCWLYAGNLGDRWFDGDSNTQLALADAVAARAMERGGDAGIGTGSARFDGEWDLGTCQMTVLGLSQVIRQHPGTRDRYLPAIDACLDWLITPSARAFGTRAWGADALEAKSGTHAYAGYIAVALGSRRLLGDDPRFDDLHDELSMAMVRGLEGHVRRFQTYPQETYPVDQSTAIAAVELHMRATGVDHSVVLEDYLGRYRAASVDPASGMLFQSLSPQTGQPTDAARASGTAFAAYFLKDADPDLSRDLYRSLRHANYGGLGGIYEYAAGQGGLGDVDSGPVLLGVSVSATGFGMAGARIHGDRDGYRRMYRTAHVFGVPVGGRFRTGGGIGNAIMLAMLTAE